MQSWQQDHLQVTMYQATSITGTGTQSHFGAYREHRIHSLHWLCAFYAHCMSAAAGKETTPNVTAGTELTYAHV